jgi:NAD(P)-dependent dehydrogenase (short-subunit alcohol dehydrogenase family)
VCSAAEKLAASGHKTIGIRCNVAEESEVAAAIDRTVSDFGRLDVAFNNAGSSRPRPKLRTFLERNLIA